MDLEQSGTDRVGREMVWVFSWGLLTVTKIQNIASLIIYVDMFIQWEEGKSPSIANLLR